MPDGGRFRPYAKSTKKARTEEGRQISFVDLNFSGKMLGSLTFKVTKSKGTLFLEEEKKQKKHFFTIKE